MTINYDSLGRPAYTLKYTDGVLITRKASATDAVGLIFKSENIF